MPNFTPEEEKTIGEAGSICQPFFGSDYKLGVYCEIGPHNVFEHVSFGDFSYTGPMCTIQNAEVGMYANIAAMVRVGPTDHPMQRPTQHHFSYRRKMYGFADLDDQEFFSQRQQRRTEIGCDTWLGHGSIVLAGRKVGHGAVVGAGSVVTKDVAPYEVVAGNPARHIRFRFETSTIASLLAIRWWDWPIESVKAALDDFCGDVDAFVGKYWNRGGNP